MLSRCAAGVLLVTACTTEPPGPPPNATLADLSGVVIVVTVYSSDETPYEGIASVGITSRPLADGSCPTLDDSLAGTFGGQAMHVISRGQLTTDPTRCTPPQLVPDHLATTTVVELHDRSHSITATFTTDQLAPRSASHPTWRLSAGGSATFDWTPASDLVAATPHVSFSTAADPSPTDVTSSIVNGQIVAAVPSQVGSGSIFIQLDSSGDPVQSAQTCDGASACIVGPLRNYSHTVEIR